MTCRDCFHNCVCGSSSQYSDPKMCKCFVGRYHISYGESLEALLELLDRRGEAISRLERELHSSELQREELEREMVPLRIIKQTLEMCSRAKFNF